MWFALNKLAAWVCLANLISGACSHLLSNELLRVKLHLAGHTIGAAGATGFASGLLAGAAYLHHKKYHNTDIDPIVAKRYIKHEYKDDERESKKDDDEVKWHVHKHQVEHHPVVSVKESHHVVYHSDHDDDDHHDLEMGLGTSYW
ncbi:hypothetical protein BIW11_09715 [Tropilaelaps mercedesae]|uniref:Uncharacterized protein n=1 Tax=Tropilaelaps mercedesae TaxID=418985 RepID=A0A1V9XJC4_9ACAR|nr:hypothetical protein BIW11_09715 [Tropilaelaps mercedesae]